MIILNNTFSYAQKKLHHKLLHELIDYSSLFIAMQPKSFTRCCELTHTLVKSRFADNIIA